VISARDAGRFVLGAVMVVAGAGHLSFARTEFTAQVPEFVPLPPDVTVLVSGVVEIALGAALLLSGRNRAAAGLALAVFFVLIFPGNLAQWLHRRDAFGLDSDTARLVRLFFQPVLIGWALWCTGAWRLLRRPGSGGAQAP
jgi:uncharacterized membrane protein